MRCRSDSLSKVGHSVETTQGLTEMGCGAGVGADGDGMRCRWDPYVDRYRGRET
jgi:hypothetical protein